MSEDNAVDWDIIPTADLLAEFLDEGVDRLEVETARHIPSLARFPLIVATVRGERKMLAIGDGELDNLSFLRGEIENSVATNVGDHDALIARHEDAASEGIIQIVWVQGGRFFNLAGDWNEADARRRAIGISDSVQRAV